ncbi:MAG: response regulator [Phormidesmis sp.]
MKFLLVEDDLAFAESVKQLLETHYYSVDLAADGYMALEMADVFSYDLILLDWMLPKRTGMQVCQALRDQGDRTPIILMTTKDSETDEVAGLDAGADDYLVKPFGFEELLARIRALLRRAEGMASPILEWGDLRLDPSSAQVSCCQANGEEMPIVLTPKEYGLLEVFMRNPSRIFSLDALLDKVWPFDDAPTTGAIRTHIKGLRQKLKPVGLAEVIDTVYGLGYRLSPAIAVVVPRQDTGKTPQKASTAVAESTATPQITPEVDLSALWQPVQASYLQRVESLARTLDELPVGDQQNVHEAIASEAHTLAGSLGSFGFVEATPQCRQIERIFREHDALGSEQLLALRVAIAKVREMITPAAQISVSVTAAEQVPGQRSEGLAGAKLQKLDLRATPAAKLLIVDDDPAMLTLLQGLLSNWGFRMRLLSDPQQFWQTLEQFNPDLVILDIEMPHFSGFDLCQALRDQPRWSDLPVLFLSAHTEADAIQKVFAIGADDYIRKPIVAAELVARITTWLARARSRRTQAEIDLLTGVANRSKSTQDLTRLLGLAERYRQPLSLIAIDFDNFKRVNTGYGHAVGDRLLRRFGACLRTTFRDKDVIARWGGEEFIVGLYGVDRAKSKQQLDSLLLAWQRACNVNEDDRLQVSFSAGIAVYPQDATDLQALYQAADRALSQAKAANRNLVLSKV